METFQNVLNLMQTHVTFLFFVLLFYYHDFVVLMYLFLSLWAFFAIRDSGWMYNITNPPLSSYAKSPQKPQFKMSNNQPFKLNEPSKKKTFWQKTSHWFHKKRTSPPKKSLSADSIKENNECIVCMNAKINTILMPCSHMELCEVCAQSITECCSCRQKIESRHQVFSPLVL